MLDRSDPLGIKGKLDVALDDLIPAKASNRRVYVGNLPYSATWQDLKDHMKTVGNVVHCDIIPQPGTALGSKGCGIVEFKTVDEAQKAINTLQDTMVKGRPIFLREDREDQRQFSRLQDASRSLKSSTLSGGTRNRSRSRSRGRSKARGRSGSTGGGGQAGRVVYVGNLPYSASWQDLKDHMRGAGNVLHCDIFPERGRGYGSKGCGLVEYATAAEARRAIKELHDTELKGRLIFVREDREAKHSGSASRGQKGREASGAPWRDSPPRGSAVGRRVFVGNLAYSVNWQELKDLMREAGNVVHCDIISEPGTACGSKGCGIVEFARHADAKRAIRIFTDRELKGRPIWLREDREE